MSMLYDGALIGTIVGVVSLLIYNIFKVELAATAADITHDEIKDIVKHNTYFRLSRICLVILPLAGFLAGLLRNSEFAYVGLTVLLIVVAAFTISFILGSVAVDRFKR